MTVRERYVPFFKPDAYCSHTPMCGVWEIDHQTVDERGREWSGRHLAVGFNDAAAATAWLHENGYPSEWTDV